MPDNGSDIKQNETVQELSVQKRTEKERVTAVHPFPFDGTSSSILWFGRENDFTEIAPWWSPQRDRDLDEFTRRPGNDILQGAISSMVKKFRSMNWTLTGPEKTISRYQRMLAETEFGKGWEFLLGKSLQPYLNQDKGAFWELIGLGDPDGPLIGPVLGIAHLDSQFCQLTGDIEFPVIYNNSKEGFGHRMHATRVVHLVDMPSSNEWMNNTGFCSVSRVIASSSVLLKLAKYKNEKLDDLPEAGLLIFNNILPQKWDDAKADYQRERRRMGQQYWTNVMAFFSLDPAQAASAELISFSNLPDAFNEKESVELYVNILSLAFGVDVREFWPMSAGPLGTAQETQIQHQKAKGKGVGDIISTIERAINWQILPPSVEFSFDFQDDEEDKLRAEIEDIKAGTIMSMWRPDAINPSPVTSMEIRQMLADNVDYFKDDFLTVDVTEEEQATDMDRQKMFGPVRRIDRYGNITRIKNSRGMIRQEFNRAMTLAEKNYRSGVINERDMAEFVISEMLDK